MNKSAMLLSISYVCWSAYASYLTTVNWVLNKIYTEK
ncbi:hypothetical protein [Mammaliicoccus sciuri]